MSKFRDDYEAWKLRLLSCQNRVNEMLNSTGMRRCVDMKGNRVFELYGTFKVKVPVWGIEGEQEAMEKALDYVDPNQVEYEVLDVSYEEYEPEYNPGDDDDRR